MYRISMAIVILMICLSANAQEILVSPDINIRSNFGYDIIGQVNDRLVLFRDGGSEHIIQAFDDEMGITFEGSIFLEDEKADIYNIIEMDTAFQLLYGYNKKDSVRVMSRLYNESAELIDSLCLFTMDRKLYRRFKYVNSEDKSKTLLFCITRKDNLLYFLIDNRKRILRYYNGYEFNEFDVLDDFQNMVIGNDGLGMAYFDSDNYRFTMDAHKGHIVIFNPSAPNGYSYHQIDYEGNLTIDSRLAYNNKNKQVVFAGLYSSLNNISSEGYFQINKPILQFAEIEKLSYQVFQKEFIGEVIGTKKKKTNALNDLIIKDLVLRDDGGLLYFFESYKEFARRSTYRNYSRRESALYGNQGWVDYYNEDIIIVSTHPDGKEHWKQVLHKKQFSQDDEAIFSSYYIFKTPSRIRLIYNDEIAKSNTISEYLLDPLGRYERRSLLNTEYENLRIRFNDALQLSSNSLVVPSQQSYNLNLVKISY